MRKTILIITITLIAAVLISSCSGGGSSNKAGSSDMSANYAPSASPSPPSDYQSEYAYDTYEVQGNAMTISSTVAAANATGQGQSSAALGEMLIYTSEVSIESTDFDESMSSFNTMMKGYNAFFENMYISGSDNPNVRTGQLRYADYTVRVPKEHFQEMLDRLYDIGNVLYIRTNAVNITAQYTDTDSRLNTYRIEESRLLAMLEKTATVEEMIQVESRLSEVRYQIESLTAALRNWQNQVNYCTVEVNIREVARLSESSPYPRTYAQELVYGIGTTVDIMGEFFKTLFKAVVVLSPLLLLLAVVLAIILIIRKRRPRRKKQEVGEAPINEIDTSINKIDDNK